MGDKISKGQEPKPADQADPLQKLDNLTKDPAELKPKPKPEGKDEPLDEEDLNLEDEEDSDDDDLTPSLKDDEEEDDDSDDDESKLKSKPSPAPKTLQEAMKQLAIAQKALKRANKEAASRRIALRKAKEDKQLDVDERLQKAEHELADFKAQESFKSIVQKAELTFANVKAESDALTYTREVLAQEGNEDMKFVVALKQVLKERPYLLKKVAPVDLNDSVRSNANGELVIDERSIAGKYGLKYVEPEKGAKNG